MNESQDKALKEKAEIIEQKIKLLLEGKKRHLHVAPSDKDVEQFERLEGC